MMSRRSKKDVPVKPLASLIQTVPAEKVALPPPSALLISQQQPHGTAAAAAINLAAEQATLEQELQALRQGTHPGFLRALDNLDQQQQEAVLAVHRVKEDRLRNAEEMFVAEMQAVEDDYREEAENLREKMMEEIMTKLNEAKGVSKNDMVTRGKRKTIITKDERPKKRTNLKGMKYTLTNDEISGDLEQIRSSINGLSGNTRSKVKL